MGALRYAGAGALAVAAVVAIAGGDEPATAQGGGEPRPNVVVIMSDDQTAVSQSEMTRTNELIGDEGASFAN